jgi:hypothetical protein
MVYGILTHMQDQGNQVLTVLYFYTGIQVTYTETEILILSLILSDNVCIDSMSLTITRRTLDRCSQNIASIQSSIQRYQYWMSASRFIVNNALCHLSGINGLFIRFSLYYDCCYATCKQWTGLIDFTMLYVDLWLVLLADTLIYYWKTEANAMRVIVDE